MIEHRNDNFKVIFNNYDEIELNKNNKKLFF